MQTALKSWYRQYSKSSDTIEPSILVNYSLRLCEIDSKTDMNIEDIPKHYESLLDKSQKLDSEIKSKQKQYQELKSQMDEALKERSITSERLKRFDSDKKSFSRLGLDVDDSENFAKMIFDAKLAKYNIAEIHEHITKEKSHEKRLLELEKKIQIQEITEKQNQTKLEKQEKTMNSNSKLIKTI